MKRIKGLGATLGMFLALGAGGCTCDGDAAQDLRPSLSWKLEADPTGWATYLVDFGAVAVGDRVEQEIPIENHGSSALVLAIHPPAAPFAMAPESGRLDVEVGGVRPLTFGFAPVETSDSKFQVIVTVNTNERSGDANHTIRLVGEAVPPSLDCEPDPLDFGKVVQGESKTSSILCTNTLTAPLSVELEGFRGNARTAFLATFIRDDEGPLVLGPDESIEIEVEYRGVHLGENEASLVLRDGSQHLLAQIPVRGETMDSALQIHPGLCLDFEYVAIDASKQLPLFVENIGAKDLEVTSFEFSDESGAFRVVTETPLQLPAGGEPAEVLIEFQPSVGGLVSTQISARGQDEDGVKLTASGCASGFGGGPGLSCHPASMDFGHVAVGIPASLQFRCFNDGYAPQDSTVDPLFVDEVSSSNERFTATLYNADGTTGPKTAGYEIGETFTIEVEYAPDSESFDAARIGVHSASAAGGVLELNAAGQGRLLPPCEFSVIPPRVRFGIVDRGQELEHGFTIVNHLDSACLIHDLRLTDDSDPAFFVEPISFYELEGLEALRIPVTFAPTAHAPSILGAVHFQISHPEHRDQRVELEGISDEACIEIFPAHADFGLAGIGCSSRTQEIRIQNVCRRPINLWSIELSEQHGAEQFHISGRPIFPLWMEARASHVISVTFSPNQIGPVEAALEIEVEGSSFGESFHYLSRLTGEGSASDTMQTDGFQQREQPKVDILWVMDNSGSFDPYQERISENLPAFLNYANENGIDWHIAVTTTGLTRWSEGCPGGALGGEDGRFFPIDGSSPRILNRRTPDLDAAWRNNIMVGTCHSVERALEAGKRALSEPLIGSEKDPRYPDSGYQDGNAGFLRRDADLSVIFVTDEVEQSPATPASYVHFFQGLKPSGDKEVRLHAITGPKESQGWMNCDMVEYGDRLLAAVDMTDGVWLNICTPTDDHEAWSAGLRRMSEGAFGFVSRFVLRGYPASLTADPRVNEKDIEVRIDGRLQPPTEGTNQVWTYDSVGNAIDFTHFYQPPPGAQVTATYKVRCN